MIHSMTEWKLSPSPNYDTNVDLIYPYSEVPYIGNYKLVRLPLPKDQFVEHVDYWGEGRITVVEGSSGYKNCYNVNHQYQPVSNGPDRDRKIPNRIPVISYTNCDTSSYIKDDSVKLVTLMGAPINKSCAKDIARMVNHEFGRVVVYGFGSDTPAIRNLNEELNNKGLYFCHNYKLDELLKEITLFDINDHRGYLNVTDLGEELFKKVDEGDIENAVSISKTLKDNDYGSKIVEIVNKLLKGGKKNIMKFAFDLWSSENRDIITNCFPVSFKLIFNKDNVKIISKTNLLTLKADINEGSDKEGLVLGVGNENNEKLRWEVIPMHNNNILYFKIMEMEHGKVLKLDNNQAKLTSQDDHSKAHWLLEPIKLDDDILFYIVNMESNQRLIFNETADEHGQSYLIGNNGSINDHPELYGWFIAPF